MKRGNILKEAKILESLNHSNVVNFKNVYYYNLGQNILRKTSPPPFSMSLVCVNNLGVN